MGRRRSRIVAPVIGLVVGCSAAGASAAPEHPFAVGPAAFAVGSLARRAPVRQCELNSVLAYPTGLAPAKRAVLDKDGDGLVDDAERELAACVVPEYHFDSEEPALRGASRDDPVEPVVLFAVYPDGFDARTRRLRIRVVFVELFANDGGFIFCNFPEANGCNSHRGDAQVREVVLEATSLTTARIVSAAGCDDFEGTHVKLFASWGKHHGYCQPYVCDDPKHRDACDCGHPACGLGHWDRADGKGPVRRPTVSADQNVGQREAFDYGEAPPRARTPRGFVNALAAFGFPGEYVYDVCRDRVCDPFAPYWKPFREGKAWMEQPIASLYRSIIRPATDLPLGLVMDQGRCTFGPLDPAASEAALAQCDPCPMGACSCYADGRDKLVQIGFDDPPVADDGDRSDEASPPTPVAKWPICSNDDASAEDGTLSRVCSLSAQGS